MNYKRRLLSQNFLRNQELVARLVGMANFGPNDTVIDIGAGRGVITRELAKVAKEVVAVEIDPRLEEELRRQFSDNPKVKVVLSDIRRFTLPNYPYKVFANIPFHLTADIVYKLLYYSKPPTEAYLIMAKEAAQKFSGFPRETQFSLLAQPWFDFKILVNIDRSEFTPDPSVDIVLLRISVRQKPLIEPEEEILYKSFIKFAFSTWKKDLKKGLSKILTYSQWKKLAKDNKFNFHSRPTDLNLFQYLSLFRFISTKAYLKKDKFI